MTGPGIRHHPVLLNEALAALKIREAGLYVDGTFGRGGHAREILAQIGPEGRLLAIDKDPAAISAGREAFGADPRVIFEQGSFAMLARLVAAHGWLGQVDGILLDLGVSSPQLDEAARGFSFRLEGPLDMRMDPTRAPSAAEWLAGALEAEIAQVLFEYGEERFSRRIARAIVTARETAPIETTTQLAEIVRAAIPRWEPGKDPATRSFQAIRIFINRELEDLESCLGQVIDVLRIGGRLAVISFHSLEDRIVKQFIRAEERGPEFPRGLPVQYTHQPRLRAVGKAQRAGADEVAVNIRARSAVLRVAERVR